MDITFYIWTIELRIAISRHHYNTKLKSFVRYDYGPGRTGHETTFRNIVISFGKCVWSFNTLMRSFRRRAFGISF